MANGQILGTRGSYESNFERNFCLREFSFREVTKPNEIGAFSQGV